MIWMRRRFRPLAILTTGDFDDWENRGGDGAEDPEAVWDLAERFRNAVSHSLRHATGWGTGAEASRWPALAYLRVFAMEPSVTVRALAVSGKHFVGIK